MTETFAALLKKALADFAALTPEQKRAHCRAQRRSWIVGEMMLEHPEMTREEAERIFTRVEEEKLS